MKEITAIIRMNMINQTKEALTKEGFSSFHCLKVMGRGKKKVDFSLIEEIITEDDVPSKVIAEAMSECHQFIPKRLLTIVVKDDEVKKAVSTIIDINSNGTPGDGKIFVSPISESIRIRTGETGDAAL